MRTSLVYTGRERGEGKYDDTEFEVEDKEGRLCCVYFSLIHVEVGLSD